MLRPTTTSTSITDGIRVSVTSRYIPEQSVPRLKRFVWAYTIRIVNESASPAKLVSRHWVIVDATQKVEEVRGPGVVGETPRLEPGQTFQYTSGCVLQTSRGTMRGEYQMVRDDGAELEVEIAPFALELPPTLN